MTSPPGGSCASRQRCTGGSACFHLGGTWIEDTPGDKKRRVDELGAAYAQQLADGRE